MNYVVEEGVDFWSQLSAEMESTNEPETESCPLSYKPFDRNAISLPCGHKFNYVSLVNEIASFKGCRRRYLGFQSVEHLQIMCPYCRTIHNGVLPFIPDCGVVKTPGVTAPGTRALPHRKCSHVLTSGARKGQICHAGGFESDYGDICERHYRLRSKPKPASGQKRRRPEDWDNWSTSQREAYDLPMADLRTLVKESAGAQKIIAGMKKEGKLARSKVDLVFALHPST